MQPLTKTVQVFWLVLEAAAGNESSHGYVRLSSVACYALALHTGGHLLLYRCAGRNWNHHALEFLLDLVTDVVGFAWINLAEETLAQVSTALVPPPLPPTARRGTAWPTGLPALFGVSLKAGVD